MLRHHERLGGPAFWAAIERTAGEFVGWFELQPAGPARPDDAELGYRLRRPAWGKGYASEGTRALVDRGFTEFGLQRIVATTMAVNAASRRVMEKAGLRYVRTFHESWPEPNPGHRARRGGVRPDARRLGAGAAVGPLDRVGPSPAGAGRPAPAAVASAGGGRRWG
ncbi:MAG TPA: GNAT family N-acetyltransferase [Micromonosporaceae bacterium]